MMFSLFTGPEFEAIWLSVKVSLVCTAIVMPLSVVAGWAMARKEFAGKTLLNGVLHLPLVMPPVTIGYLLMVSLGSRGFFGSYLYRLFDFRLAFTWYAAVIAAVVVSFPLAVRSVRIAMEMVDPKLEQAARSLGAGPLRTFIFIT
ncbi:MAG: ABC transporter permease subunit, partial [Planctomycetes bacterium]|nr:ABC transporter permease subunit [Planctomycetota bacterium]